jgi:hypothetical protein
MSGIYGKGDLSGGSTDARQGTRIFPTDVYLPHNVWLEKKAGRQVRMILECTVAWRGSLSSPLLVCSTKTAGSISLPTIL